MHQLFFNNFEQNFKFVHRDEPVGRGAERASKSGEAEKRTRTPGAEREDEANKAGVAARIAEERMARVEADAVRPAATVKPRFRPGNAFKDAPEVDDGLGVVDFQSANNEELVKQMLTPDFLERLVI